MSKINDALDSLTKFQVEMHDYMERIAVAVERLVEIEELRSEGQGY